MGKLPIRFCTILMVGLISISAITIYFIQPAIENDQLSPENRAMIIALFSIFTAFIFTGSLYWAMSRDFPDD